MFAAKAELQAAISQTRADLTESMPAIRCSTGTVGAASHDDVGDHLWQCRLAVSQGPCQEADIDDITANRGQPRHAVGAAMRQGRHLEAEPGPGHAWSSVLKDMLEVQALLTQHCLHDREALRTTIRAVPSSPGSFLATICTCKASPGGSWGVGRVGCIVGAPPCSYHAALGSLGSCHLCSLRHWCCRWHCCRLQLSPGSWQIHSVICTCIPGNIH